MNSSSEIETLRLRLGLPKAPLVLDGLTTVYDYFTKHLHVSPAAWISYLRGIDFHCPVSTPTLHSPQELVRHKPDNSTSKPFLYFGQPGVSPMRTGTNFPSVTFERYRLARPILSLKSIASSIAFSPADRIVRPGGATQFIIASSDFSALIEK